MQPEQEKTFEFETSGTKEVSTTRPLGGKSYPNPSGSYYIEIISPQPLTSAKDATYSIRCKLPRKPEEQKPTDDTTGPPPPQPPQ